MANINNVDNIYGPLMLVVHFTYTYISMNIRLILGGETV